MAFFPPSKLSDAASQLWVESASKFQKKPETKIELGFGNTISTNSSAGSDEKASTSSAISSGYVFGSRVSERVTNKSHVDHSANDSVESINKTTAPKPMDVSSIFKRIAEKSAGGTNAVNLWKSSTSNGNTSWLTENSSTDQLEESAKQLSKKTCQTGPADSDAEQIKTGEEDELNLLHISCKFYQYITGTKIWQERGMGSLRINQNIEARDDIRLVGRQSGNQRVLINSKIFPEMILEELSEKRLKISAQTNESDLPQLFLIQASPGSIASLQHMLQKYIDASGVAKATQQMHQMRKRRLDMTISDAAELGESDENATDGGPTEPTKKFVPEDEKRKEEADDGGAKRRQQQRKKKNNEEEEEEEEED